MERITPDELERRVDEILFYFWDPIGVNPEASARGEYRSYVAGILKMLEQSKSANEIADLLCKIEVEYMSLPARKESAIRAAELLVYHCEALKSGYA